ncbi:MAG TPA: PQQ-binding-like beta-propeller repeat protein, partial [Thermoplasmata archaeon]|nr:PQQ-binding-like beta-propeller repeat protein [Thermoplasmata archaeon]
MYDVERTGANTLEHTIGVDNVATLEPIWSVPSNGSDFSAPIVVNGTVYYGSWNGDEYAVNASTGTVLWQTYLGTDNSCGYVPMGISSTPAYANGTLYLGGGDGYWYALNASTGAVDWSFLPGSLTENYYDWASALVYRSSLYIGTASCFDNPLVPASLIEVSLTSSHRVIAQFNTTPPGEIGESIWSTPALDPATNTVWVSTGNENPPGYPP